MNRIPIIFSALITMGTAANATTLAAGGMYGGPTQNTAVCYLFNSGSTTVSISQSAIIEQFCRLGTSDLQRLRCFARSRSYLRHSGSCCQQRALCLQIRYQSRHSSSPRRDGDATRDDGAEKRRAALIAFLGKMIGATARIGAAVARGALLVSI
jgi:hypothetical protein